MIIIKLLLFLSGNNGISLNRQLCAGKVKLFATCPTQITTDHMLT